MKSKIVSFLSAILFAAVSLLHAADFPAFPTKKGSPEFERMKSLVGTWKGTSDMGQGPVEITSQYRILAGGSVVEERSFPGTPHEMVTMYFDNAEGKLALTHYCVMGNRPEMVLEKAEGNTFQFKFNKACGIDCAKESHMHALKLTFNDGNTITASCKALIEGKEMPEKPTTLKRIAGL
jgi:hypothetical protein